MHVEVEHIADRRFAIRARDHELTVDDSEDDGAGFRPTELLLGALGACMAETMADFARFQQIPVGRIRMQLVDEVEKAPSRIGAIQIVIEVDTDADEQRQVSLAQVASACKINQTLQTPPTIEVDFSVR